MVRVVDPDTGGYEPGQTRVDVVVVNHNAAKDLGACMASLVAEPVGRIVVVDNDSHDSSRTLIGEWSRAHPNIVWLPTGCNLGFGGGANRGFAATTRSLVLLLNPDAVVVPGAVASMSAAMEDDPGLGAVGPQVTNLDGARYPSARAFPNMVDAMAHGALGLIHPGNRWSARYRNPDVVDWVSGTAMLLRRTALEQVGGFDESFFMYVEDVDLCWRLRLSGWCVGYVPKALVRHRIGGSSEHRPYRMIAAHHRSLWRFAWRTTRGANRLLLPVVAVGLLARTVVAAFARLVRKTPPAAQ